MVHGFYRFGSRRIACRNAYCTTCGEARFSEGRRSWVVLHVAFIPVLPVGVETRWYCQRCGEEVDAHRPSRPWAFVAGMILGLVACVAGVSFLREEHERDAALGCFLLGAALLGGCAYGLKSAKYRAYEAGRRGVTPLAGDHCPYCEQPIFASVKPRCQACRVDIVTC